MWAYPQITKLEPTEDGYQCEAVMIYALAEDIPLEYPDGSGALLTAENFEEATAQCPAYRYTFQQAQDGHYILRGLEVLRPQYANLLTPSLG